MELRLLKMFRTVATAGGLAEASRELHLTASALSHALKALETELGARLFDRVGNRLLLNQAGEQFLSQIEAPLAALENAATAIQALGRWGQASLRIGASVSACQHILPPVFRELRKHSPRPLFQVKSGDMNELVEGLRRNHIDLALGVEPEHAPDLESRALFEDELLFALSPQHPWTDGRSLSKEDISREPLILYQRTSLTSRLVGEYFAEQQIAPTTIMEIGSITAIKEMVKLNLGVGVLAPWVLDYELAKGLLRMRSLGAKRLRRNWTVTYLTRKRLGMIEEHFFALCRTQAASMRLDRKDISDTTRVGVG